MKINNELKIKMLKKMVKIRLFEEEIQSLYKAGYIPGSLHLSSGQEAIAVGFCMNLRKSDYILSNHRGHHHIIAKGGEYKYIMAELFGKKTGYCKGKGGSMHIANKSLGIFGTNGIVGGNICIATGLAFSSKYQGLDRITLCFLGDGATNTGAFHEGVNFASVRKSPVIFIIENNQYAISVPRKLSDCLDDLSERAKSYNIQGYTIDGNDVLKIYEIAKNVIKETRNGNGPFLIECKTYRWHGHHAGEPKDGIEYRTIEELNSWRKKCPIEKLKNILLEKKIINEDFISKLKEEIEKDLKTAINFANESCYPEKQSLYEGVYIDEIKI